MSTFSSVTLILFPEPGQSDRQIRQAVAAVGKCEWRAQVILVDRDSNKESPERITYRPIPLRCESIGQAIEAAKHPVIAIADQGIEIDVDQWKFMVNRIDQSPIQSTFADCISTASRPRRFVRTLMWIYRMIVRALLRTGRSEFDRGLTIFKRTEIETFQDDYANLDFQSSQGGSSETDSFYLTRLLSMARLNRRSVLETRIGSIDPGATVTPPNKRQIAISILNVLRVWWNKIMFPRQQYELPQKKYKAIEKIAASVVLLLIAAFVLLRCLNFPLFEPDEARNAQLAMNIANSGQWMSLSLQDDYYWDKPPLQAWAIAVSYKAFGISHFATRFPVAVASLLTVLFTLLLGQRLVGFRSAWFGTLLLLLSTGFVCAGRYVTMDASLTAMATAMLLFGFVAMRGRFKKHHAIAAGIACGIGILVKGPVICVLCLPPLLAISWLSTSSQVRPRHWWLWFAVPAFLLAAPWFVATAVIHPDFLVYFFWTHHVVRFSEAFNHREPFWYYAVGIFILMFPASYLIPSLAKFLTSRKPENRLLRTREHGFLFLSAVWIIAFFSISDSKLPTYILPALPAICLLMGSMLDRKLFSRNEYSIAQVAQTTGSTKRTLLEKVGRRAPLELVFWFITTSLAIWIWFEPQSISLSLAELVIPTFALTMLAIASIVYRKKPKISWTCFAVIGLCLVSLSAHRLIPAISTVRSMHLAASKIQATEEFQNAPIVFFGREDYGAGLMLDESEITWFNDTQTKSMIEFLTEHPSTIIVSSDDPMETLRRDLTWSIEIEECDLGRHIYVSRPNPTVIAQQHADTIQR